MPTYEYACTDCGTTVEVFQRFGEEPLQECGVCGGRLRKVFHPAGIVFKGSGFYATDSRAAPRARDAKDGASKPSKDEGSKDAGSKDAGSKTSESRKSGDPGSSAKEKTA